MAALNPLTRELVFKVVFYGPGLGGKTTTLQAIHERTKPEHRGKLVSLATPTERTLYFDFLPLRVTRVRNMNVRLQLFTVPGQVYFSATRKLVLTGADGIVFVADSQSARMDANQEALEDLNANLAEHGRSLSRIPHTFQWNKRDLGEVVSEGELDRRFNLFAAPATATVATRCLGVFDGLEKISRLVVEAYKADMPRGDSSRPVLLDADELGIEDAVRELAESPVPRLSSHRVLETASAREAVAVARAEPQSAPISSGVPSSAPISTGRPSPVSVRSAILAESSTIAPAPEGSLSLAELFPEGDRGVVRRAEAAIGAGDAAVAVLACDVLVTRVLASGASLAGSMEAPRDPALGASLLGLPGPRYLAFRAVVRAARRKEAVSLRQAMQCFVFALEARRARDAVDVTTP